jgi:hypothetical protein
MRQGGRDDLPLSKMAAYAITAYATCQLHFTGWYSFQALQTHTTGRHHELI